MAGAGDNWPRFEWVQHAGLPSVPAWQQGRYRRRCQKHGQCLLAGIVTFAIFSVCFFTTHTMSISYLSQVGEEVEGP